MTLGGASPSSADENKPARPILILTLLWVALSSSVLFYTLFVYVIADVGHRVPTVTSSDLFPRVLAGIAVLVALLAWWLPRKLWAAARAKLVVGEKSDAELCRIYMAPFIVRVGLFEAVALLGIIVSTALVEPSAYLPYLMVSAIGIFASKPTLARVKKALHG